MFIPLFDVNPTRLRPLVTPVLLASNVMVWLWQLQTMSVRGAEEVLFEWGLVPALLWTDPVGRASTLVSSMFLHGSWAHLGGNLLFLHVFGDNVEEALGRVRYAAFYVLGGVLAALAQALVEPVAMVPMVGASGAVAAVLGAYLVLYPHAPITVLNTFILPWPLLSFPAWLAIGMWFVLNLVGGLAAFGMGRGGGVAYFAHLGGFAAGLLAIRLCMAGRQCRNMDRWRAWRPPPRPSQGEPPTNRGFPPDW